LELEKSEIPACGRQANTEIFTLLNNFCSNLMIYTFRDHPDGPNQKVTQHVFNRAGKFEIQRFKCPKQKNLDVWDLEH